MISRIFRPIRDGFKGVGRHASMSIQSASAVTLALIIISLFLMFSMTVQNFTKGIEESVSISVLVDYSKESAEDEDAISLAIKNISGVSTVTYSSKDEEFQYYLESFDDEKTRKALIQAQKMGIKVVLASGRPTPGLRHEAKALELEKFYFVLCAFFVLFDVVNTKKHRVFST